MFDFDAGKLLVIGVVALIVIGPKELPRVLRQVGQAIAKLRRMASEFQGQFMDAMKEAELDDLRKEATKFAESVDPTKVIKNEMAGLENSISSALDKPALDEATRQSLAEDPDGVFLPTKQAGLPEIEPPGPLILPEPVDLPASQAAESMILPEHPGDPAPVAAASEPPKPARSGEA